MRGFEPANYGPAIAALLSGTRLNLLTVGRPDTAFRSQLEKLAQPEAFAKPIVDPNAATACRSGLWLYHDYFDDAHSLCQDLHTPDGSYWHAILHRREPDYDNAKYWFHRVGTHPIYGALCAEAARIAAAEPGAATDFLTKQSRWDADAFVDLCENAERHSCVLVCERIQRREWELLFEHCYRAAIGAH